MDITKIATEMAKDEQGVTVPILGRDKNPAYASDGVTQVTFTVLGRDAAPVKRVIEAQVRRALRNRGKQMEPKELYENRAEIAEAALVGWSGVEDPKGAPVPLSHENVRQVLADRVYLEQIEEAVENHARFFASASTA